MTEYTFTSHEEFARHWSPARSAEDMGESEE